MGCIPTATHSGEITIFGVTIAVHHLDNGQRVIPADDMERLFEAMGKPDCPMPDESDLAELAALVMPAAD